MDYSSICLTRLPGRFPKRYSLSLSDWTGPKGRLGKMKFKMKASVYPGDTMVFKGKVSGVEKDDAGCSWANLDINLSVDEKTVTDCAVRIALPADADDNPWTRKGDQWKP